MAQVALRMFAGAREAAGVGRAEFEGETVGEVIAAAVEQFGSEFERVVGASRIWLNGDAATPELAVQAGDEVAVLPPVSGG
jgi:sulfur-carrier protein